MCYGKFENSQCVKNNILLLVFLFAFFFVLPLIFTLLATSSTDFLTAGIKLPLLCVNRSHIRYGFRAGAKAIQHSVNIASNTFIRSCGYPPINERKRGLKWLKVKNAYKVTLNSFSATLQIEHNFFQESFKTALVNH